MRSPNTTAFSSSTRRLNSARRAERSGYAATVFCAAVLRLLWPTLTISHVIVPCGDVPPGTVCTEVITGGTPPAVSPVSPELFGDLVRDKGADFADTGAVPTTVLSKYGSAELAAAETPAIDSVTLGTTVDYDTYLYSASEASGEGYTDAQVIMPSGKRIYCARTSRCKLAGCLDYTGAVFQCIGRPNERLDKAQIRYNPTTPGWDLIGKDGSVDHFGLGTPLQSMEQPGDHLALNVQTKAWRSP